MSTHSDGLRCGNCGRDGSAGERAGPVGWGEEDGEGLTQDGAGAGTGAGACFQDGTGTDGAGLADDGIGVGLDQDEVEVEETAETGDGEGLAGLGAMAGLVPVTLGLGATAGLGASAGLGLGAGTGRLTGSLGVGGGPFWRLSAAMRSLREAKWGSSSDIARALPRADLGR